MPGCTPHRHVLPRPPSGAYPGPPADVPEQIMFAAGDKVKISLDQEAFRAMQDGHGGWNEKMNQVCVLGGGGGRGHDLWHLFRLTFDLGV